MSAPGQPWNTARFSISAASRAARARSSNSGSREPRWMSSISRRDTVKGTRTSASGSTFRCRARTAPRGNIGRQLVQLGGAAEAHRVPLPAAGADPVHQPAGRQHRGQPLAGLVVDGLPGAGRDRRQIAQQMIGDGHGVHLPLQASDAQRHVGRGPSVRPISPSTASTYPSGSLSDTSSPSGVGWARMNSVELATERLAEPGRRVLPEVGQALPLLLGHVLVVGHPGLPDGCPPGRAAQRMTSRLVRAVPDVVVVADRVQRLVLRVLAEPQQLRVEDPFLGDGVHVEPGGQRLPHLAHRLGVEGRPPPARPAWRTADGTRCDRRGSAG